MQTDETRAREVLASAGKGWAEVIPADREAWIQYEDFGGAFADRVRTGSEDKTCGLQIIARHRLAFAAPPAVGREGMSADRMALTDEDLVAWAEQAKRDDWHLRFVGSDIRQLIGQLQRARSALATLHPSDREAIARVIDPKAWKRRQQHLDNISEAHWRSNHPNEGIALGMRRAGLVIADEVVALSLTKADAILALSGSLAPEGGERNPCAKIFDHLWLDPECIEGGCKSLFLRRATEALRKLTFSARTSGGTAGPDAHLMAACDEAEACLAALPPSTEKGETK